MLKRTLTGNHPLHARRHIDELQSLRGVAALAVAISHISSIYALPLNVRIAIDFIFNAHACVVVFFVLSGYVLTGSLLRRGLLWRSVFSFYFSRLFRLFPALWVASVFSALFLWLQPQKVIHPAMSRWFWFYLVSFPSWLQILLGALAVDKTLIMPAWTIFIELMGSAVMPLLVILGRAKVRWLPWAVLGTGIAAYLLAHAPHRLDSLIYLFDFALGAWVASRPWRVFAHRSLPATVLAAAVLILFRFLWVGLRHGHPVPLYDGYNDPVPMLIESISAFFLVSLLAAEHGRVQMLRSPGAIWLGNISYSLYLIHFPVAIFITKLISHRFSDSTNPLTATAVVLAVSLPVACSLAWFTYRFVELPSIDLGKKVSRRLLVNRTPVKV